MTDLDPTVVAVILGMSVATYVTKAGGLWAVGRVDLSPRAEATLDALPGAIVVSLLIPELAALGAPGWLAAAAVLLVAWRTDGVLLALASGMGTVVSLRVLL